MRLQSCPRGMAFFCSSMILVHVFAISTLILRRCHSISRRQPLPPAMALDWFIRRLAMLKPVVLSVHPRAQAWSRL
jgi:hypothetical protein